MAAIVWVPWTASSYTNSPTRRWRMMSRATAQPATRASTSDGGSA